MRYIPLKVPLCFFPFRGCGQRNYITDPGIHVLHNTLDDPTLAGGGLLDVPIFGTAGSPKHHPFRYMGSNGAWPDGTPWINGYYAYFVPLNTSRLDDPAGTIGFQDGGWQEGADYIAPRHGLGCSAKDEFAFGDRFNVVWLDGHSTALEAGDDPGHPYVGLPYGWWTIDRGDSDTLISGP